MTLNPQTSPFQRYVEFLSLRSLSELIFYHPPKNTKNCVPLMRYVHFSINFHLIDTICTVVSIDIVDIVCTVDIVDTVDIVTLTLLSVDTVDAVDIVHTVHTV